jgi:transcriptional regulator with XRE-family HTH domain
MIPYMTASRVTDLEAQFGARVRQVRRDQGLSQVELARLANVSRSAVVNLEAGAGSSLATLVKVLDALGRSDWLLTLEPPAPVFNPLDLLTRDQQRSPRGRPGPQPHAGRTR